MSKLLAEMTNFQILAQFLGVILKDGDRVKYLKVAIASQEYRVKLPKALSQSFDQKLSIGSWLKIEGSQTLDRKKGILKLEASSFSVVNAPNSELNKLEPSLTQSADSQPVADKNKNKAPCILICQKSDCWQHGGKEVYQKLEQELRDRGLSDRVQIQKTGCQKQCKQAPNLVIMPNKDRHSRVKLSQVDSLLNRYFGLN
ncbi:MAG: (2Fe-2S) ferredoxin domain-containing protein [Pseudanabaena sp. CAN_BIN31]|nr:(2Fe-2S) ferredoxin domain-containing protein [Pseudanabaena sp. CAN_BIN31]